MSGETYSKRYAGGFSDGSAGGTPVDSTFLNAVEAALVRLLGEDPAANEVPAWSTGSGRFTFQKITTSHVDAAAGITKSQLAALGIVDADVAAGAAILPSKLAGFQQYMGSVASASSIAVTPNATYLLTGTTAVNTVTGGSSGSVLKLVASGQATGVCVVLNHATTANKLSLRDSANLGIYAGESVTFVHDGTKWVESDRNLRTVLGVTAISSDVNITATTGATANTVATAPAITFDGSTPVLVEMVSPRVGAATSWVNNTLYDSGTQLSLAGFIGSMGSLEVPYHGRVRLTPSAGSKTYSWRAYVDGGTGHVVAGTGVSGNSQQAFIRISRDI